MAFFKPGEGNFWEGNVTKFAISNANEIIDKYGIDTAKLHLILAVHACRQEKPWDSKFVLKGTDLIEDLGWYKRTDLTISEKLRKI